MPRARIVVALRRYWWVGPACVVLALLDHVMPRARIVVALRRYWWVGPACVVLALLDHVMPSAWTFAAVRWVGRYGFRPTTLGG